MVCLSSCSSGHDLIKSAEKPWKDSVAELSRALGRKIDEMNLHARSLSCKGGERIVHRDYFSRILRTASPNFGSWSMAMRMIWIHRTVYPQCFLNMIEICKYWSYFQFTQTSADSFLQILQPFCGIAVSHFTFCYHCMCLCFRVSLY